MDEQGQELAIAAEPSGYPPPENRIKRFLRACASFFKAVPASMYVAVFASAAAIACAVVFGVNAYRTEQRMAAMQTRLEAKIEAKAGELDAKIAAGDSALSSALEDKSKTAQAGIDGVKTSVGDLNAKVDGLSGLKSRIDTLSTQAVLDVLQHEIESGTVTDYFYVAKATFNAKDGRLDSAVIDVGNQPMMNYYYKGYGLYNLDDRTLRTRSLAIVEEVKNYYINGKSDKNPIAWDKNTTVALTVKNYPIGYYKDGRFFLQGEK